MSDETTNKNNERPTSSSDLDSEIMQDNFVRPVISTTLFVPFFLKERVNNDGEFLNKGFEIDNILEKYCCENEKSHLSFLKIGQLNNAKITEALTKMVINEAALKIPLESDNEISFFSNQERFTDRKYLNTLEGFYQPNKIKSKSEQPTKNVTKFDNIYNKLQIGTLKFKLEYETSEDKLKKEAVFLESVISDLYLMHQNIPAV